MKKIVFEKESEIHVDSVTKDCIISVHREGKPVGIMMYSDNFWQVMTSDNSKKYYNSDVRQAFSWFGGDPEFHVLE